MDIKELHELCDTLGDEVSEVNGKIRNAGGKLSAGDIEYVDKLTHAIKSIKTTIAMMEADGYSGGYMPRMGTYRDARGISYDDRSYARKRDNMGRYSRGYSYAAEMDGIMEDLRGMMGDMPEEKRREVERFIDKMR